MCSVIMHERDVSIEICKRNTVRRELVPAEEWEVNNWKGEIITFVIDSSLKSSISVNIVAEINI